MMKWLSAEAPSEIRGAYNIMAVTERRIEREGWRSPLIGKSTQVDL